MECTYRENWRFKNLITLSAASSNKESWKGLFLLEKISKYQLSFTTIPLLIYRLKSSCEFCSLYFLQEAQEYLFESHTLLIKEVKIDVL